MKRNRIPAALGAVLAVVLGAAGCGKTGELSEEEIAALTGGALEDLIARTTSKPWRGEDFEPGIVGGTWNGSATDDPKSFNLYLAEADAATAGIVGAMHDYLLDYDYVKREFIPRCASGEIIVNEEAGTLDVVYTLRDNLSWSFYNSDKKIPVTSDDVIFWYNEIEGDEAFQSQAYSGQFITMEDGSRAHVDIEKIDSRRFVFHFPRINADPFLFTNMNFGPKFIYEGAKKSGGVEGVAKVFSVSGDPKLIPSMGRWFLTEYSPGQRLVYERNPDYWERDSGGAATVYPEREIVSIVPDDNTQYLLFKQGKLEANSLKPENVEEAAANAGAGKNGYTVFNAEGSIGASMWSFNQNPKNKDAPYYRWFTKREFRQAMSCLLNRDRIIAQVYRGLGEPKYDFFPEPNPFYNPGITLRYRYNLERAEQLLAQGGFKRGADGVLRDDRGVPVEFDLSFAADATLWTDIASIVVDECARVGVKVTPRPTDFQRLVEQLTGTFDWQSIFIGLGSNLFPSQGSNVWPSGGPLHLWNPAQKAPATEWEARIDYLYNEGSYTIDRQRASAIWDEYQRILLEECPVIYLIRSRTFVALQNRWDFTNVYYDNIGGLQTDRAWLRKE
ncbi:MAG: ABC transporter substrate-binding protein [Spirochaetaceae bacterium]|jgi:peptide/nickel transport system substrate-binding protein|nr:ABC transporter substrate-binding protein [Spirochaetaceae bacterium]